MEEKVMDIDNKTNNIKKYTDNEHMILEDLAHDVRTPLNAVLGFTELAKKYIDDKDKVKEYLDKIMVSGKALLSICNLQIDSLSEGELAEATHEKLKHSGDVFKMAGYSMLAGKRILYAEDNEFNAEIAEEILNSNGMIMERAVNGKQAVDMLTNSSPNYYDVILMDIRMPVMDGYEASRRIRNMERSDAKKIPIIALSANCFLEDIVKSQECGMNAHLSKPIDIDRLMYELANVYAMNVGTTINSSDFLADAEEFANGIPGGFFIYKAVGDEKILFANDEAVELMGCDNYNDFIQYTSGSFKGFVYEDDYEITEANIKEQLEVLGTFHDHVRYRILRKDGKLRYIDDYGHLINHKVYGEIFYVFISDITDWHLDS
ncbi:MAG: response regulator [Lachnospira sp.]